MDADACGQVLGKNDGSPPRGEDRTLHGSAQFPHVARPAVQLQRRSRPRGKLLCGEGVEFGEVGAKMVRQRQDVLLAFTQGRQRNVNGLKTVEKVPPEGFFLHHVFEISVGRCDQAEIAGGFLCGAHGADALFLKYAQKDLLQRKGKFPHFIKEQRAAAVVTAPYDGVIAECCYSAVGSDVKSGTLLCRVAVLESIFVYNSQGAGKNLRFGMDVDLVINDVDYKGTVTAAPDTAPSDASNDATKYCAVTLSDDSLKKLINDNNGITAVDAGWATIHAITAKRVNVLAVPEKAIKKDGTKTYCSVLQGNEKYDLYVEVGATAGGYVEILSGLNEGDVVVLAESTGNGSSNTDNKNNNNNKEDDNEDGDDDRKPWDSNKKPFKDM